MDGKQEKGSKGWFHATLNQVQFVETVLGLCCSSSSFSHAIQHGDDFKTQEPRWYELIDLYRELNLRSQSVSEAGQRRCR